MTCLARMLEDLLLRSVRVPRSRRNLGQMFASSRTQWLKLHLRSFCLIRGWNLKLFLPGLASVKLHLPLPRHHFPLSFISYIWLFQIPSLFFTNSRLILFISFLGDFCHFLCLPCLMAFDLQNGRTGQISFRESATKAASKYNAWNTHDMPTDKRLWARDLVLGFLDLQSCPMLILSLQSSFMLTDLACPQKQRPSGWSCHSPWLGKFNQFVLECHLQRWCSHHQKLAWRRWTILSLRSCGVNTQNQRATCSSSSRGNPIEGVGESVYTSSSNFSKASVT